MSSAKVKVITISFQRKIMKLKLSRIRNSDSESTCFRLSASRGQKKCFVKYFIGNYLHFWRKLIYLYEDLSPSVDRKKVQRLEVNLVDSKSTFTSRSKADLNPLKSTL